ncbi:uncharacterized protein RCC_08032 [Ramularia collo-cygni]|uniref:non-specific serine/threonine protein kinase n=1 Tax=Ramularia collo-cygni TaxID=112498 RepID=A0A2D3VLN1_9PEZI|nr:uncharacterized protein RCC_08032 [Ramularia collo-cygni]CZT22163.1 uncharacterized protein RCC_08032 [Ramularia collo-cygni]
MSNLPLSSAGGGADRRRSSRNATSPGGGVGSPMYGVKRASTPEPQSARKSPRRSTSSSAAGAGAISSRDSVGALPMASLQLTSPRDSDAAALDGESDTIEQTQPLSPEDARPAEYAVRTMFQLPHDALGNDDLAQLGISNFCTRYVKGIMSKERSDSEDCFEMVFLLLKKYGPGEIWQHAWPIDTYLKCGVDFGGDWDDPYSQAEVESRRSRARELEVIGASRDDIGSFASLCEDAKKAGSLYSFQTLPSLFSSGAEGVNATVARFLHQLKRVTWSALESINNDARLVKKYATCRKWGQDYISEANNLEKETILESESGERRPMSPGGWDFRLQWRLMGKKFAAGRPTTEDQVQYDAILLYVEELFTRYGTLQLPQPKRVEGSNFDCKDFCDTMWKALEIELQMSVDQVYERWKGVLGETTDQDERGKLKSRFTIMHTHVEAGWAYGLENRRPREHLWLSIERRLNALGLPSTVAAEFRRLSNMAHILAGSGIFVAPPILLPGVGAAEYVFEVLGPAFVEYELAYWGPIWDSFAIRNPNMYMQRSDLIAAKTRMWDKARSDNGPIYGPEQEDWRMMWEKLRDTFEAPDPSSVLAGRFRDLHQEVEGLVEIFGAFVRPRSSRGNFVYSEKNFAALTRSVRKRMSSAAKKACTQFQHVAVNEEERPAYEALVGTLQTNIRKGGPYFAPWKLPVILESDKDPRARGSGTDRSGLKGTWKFQGNVGKGGFGQVSSWHQIDENNNVIDRLIVKEAYTPYTTAWDDPTWWIGDVDLRRPKEYFFAKYLAELPGGSCITKPRAYAIYEGIKMYRLYMEYCQHEDLLFILQQHIVAGRNSGAIVAIPTRMLWAVFESLIGALCLMRDGCLPGGSPPTPRKDETFERMMHLDIKNPNVFLARSSPLEWPQLPKAKLGDFGLACLETDKDSEKTSKGTPGWKAPEQFDYEAKGVVSRFDRQPTTTAADVWGVGRIMLSLMNVEHVKEEDAYTYAEGVPNLKFKSWVRPLHTAKLCNLVERCLAELPADRADCAEMWSDIREHTTSTDHPSGVSFRNRMPDTEEVLHFRDNLPLKLTSRAGSA